MASVNVDTVASGVNTDEDAEHYYLHSPQRLANA